MAKGQEVNRNELAALLGVSLPTITNWIKKGCPYVERGGNGRSWVFNTADVVRWREELARGEGVSTDLQDKPAAVLEKTLLEIKVEREKLALDKEKEAVIAVELVQPAWEMMAANIRSKMLGVTAKAQSRIPGFTREQAEVLKSLVFKALGEIAADDQLPEAVATTVDGGVSGDDTAAPADS
ncbi:terminase small subunit [Microbulbifer sp. PSTR4-B]|uniref:terminase small subunit n=1 Tax=unclassified Microbulbifer TaxID=2619833 RepID=UPI00403A9168